MNIILQNLNRIREMLFLFFSFGVDRINTLRGLCLDKVLKNIYVGLPIIFDLLVFLFLPDDQDGREAYLIFVELLFTVLDFSLVDHYDPLLVIVGFFVLNDGSVGVSNNRYDEVHKNHKEEVN